MFREKEIIELLKEIARKLDILILVSRNNKIKDVLRRKENV